MAIAGENPNPQNRRRVLGFPLLADTTLPQDVVTSLRDDYNYDLTSISDLVPEKGTSVGEQAALARRENRVLLTHLGSRYLTKDEENKYTLLDETPCGIVYLDSIYCTSRLWDGVLRTLEQHYGSKHEQIANRVVRMRFDGTYFYISRVPGP